MNRLSAVRSGEPAEMTTLREVEQRILWLSTAIIDHANRVRPNPSGLKVGGHQASCASMVTIMTALWFDHLLPGDRVSVKPHASPVLHAINYLLGELDERYLTTLREFGGLQSYPSRTKDPDPADYSTGSVGIGATAPIWGALARRYVNSVGGDVGIGRQYSLVGDAELDEGACWEAIGDPMVTELGEVVWIVDLNRQSLDRVVPFDGPQRLQGMFAAAGWQVLTAKYGRLLETLFDQPGGEELRRRLDQMPNSEYQRLLRCGPAELRTRLPEPGPDAAALAALLTTLDDETLYAAIRDLGGHDLHAVSEAFDAIDDTRPTVIFAYTLKGYGLASEGHPQNHSALLTAAQLADLAARLGTDADAPWTSFPEGSTAAVLCAETATRLRRPPVTTLPVPAIPADIGRTPTGRATTQAALGRALLDLTRAAPEAARRVVTLCPMCPPPPTSAAGSTRSASGRLANAPTGSPTTSRRSSTGANALTASTSSSASPKSIWSERSARWEPPGAAGDSPSCPSASCTTRSSNAHWNPGRSASTPAARPSSSALPRASPSPPKAAPTNPSPPPPPAWSNLAASATNLPSPSTPNGPSWPPSQGSAAPTAPRPTFGCPPAPSTRPSPTSPPPANSAAGRSSPARTPCAYPLRRTAAERPSVTIAAVGATVTEALAAAERLENLHISTDVICVTSPGLLFQALQSRTGLGTGDPWVLDTAFPAHRAAPMITLLDGHPHTLAFLATIHRVRATHLGVTHYGQSGDLDSVYRHHGIDTDSVVTAALDITN